MAGDSEQDTRASTERERERSACGVVVWRAVLRESRKYGEVQGSNLGGADEGGACPSPSHGNSLTRMARDLGSCYRPLVHPGTAQC